MPFSGAKLFGAPPEKSMDWARHPELMKRLKDIQAKQAPARAAKPEKSSNLKGTTKPATGEHRQITPAPPRATPRTSEILECGSLLPPSNRQ